MADESKSPPEVEEAQAPPDVVERSKYDAAEDELVGLFLKEEDDRPGKIAFIIVAFLFIGLLLMTFPKGDKPQFEEMVVYVPEIDEHIPEIKPPEEIKKVEKLDVEKVALPDPTPDEPEPVIEPTPEPEPEPLPPNVKIVRGIPRGPPRSSGGPVRQGMAGLTNPQKVKHVEPEYPDIAKRANFGGQVILRAIVGTDGRVRNVELLKGLGRFNLDENAIEAVKKWEYEPGVMEGRPVEVIMTVRVDYQLQ